MNSQLTSVVHKSVNSEDVKVLKIEITKNPLLKNHFSTIPSTRQLHPYLLSSVEVGTCLADNLFSFVVRNFWRNQK